MLFLVLFQSVFRINNRTKDLQSVFEQQEEIKVEDVFLFKFEKAYVFNDCYISGVGFAERYKLDLSIEEVKPGASENIQRIIFVDEKGEFVFEYKCDMADVIIENPGVVLEKETVIQKISDGTHPLIIRFLSSEYYEEERARQETKE